MSDGHDSQTIYLIKPKMGGFSNDLQVMTEDGRVLFNVKSRLFSSKGKSFTVYDAHEREYITTQQHFTALFPRHDVMHAGVKVAEVGQQRIIPLEYFIQFYNGPRMRIHLGAFGSVFELIETETEDTVAEIAFEQATWVIALSNDRDPADILPMIAILYRENTIGG